MKSEIENESTDNKPDVNAPKLTNAALFLSLIRVKGKIVINYILDGFAPFVAVAALIVAVMAFNENQSSQLKLSNASVKVDNLNASLTTYKLELEKLKTVMAIEAEKQVQKNKVMDEQERQIIRSVSKLQNKMKVSPTLEEELHPIVKGEMVQPAATTTATAVPVPPVTASTHIKDKTPAGTDKKTGYRIDALKDAINKFNK